MITATTSGVTSVGSQWLEIAHAGVLLQSFTVEGLFSELVAHVRHDVANVPNLAAYVYDDDSGSPGELIVAGVQSGTAILVTATGRWWSFPVGRWFAASETVWAGLNLFGNQSMDIAYETTGGDGGSRASLSDSGTWTAGTRAYSMYAVLLS